MFGRSFVKAVSHPTNLGNVFRSVGEYAKAEEYHQKALPIKTEIGDKDGQASCYGSLGNVFFSVAEYAKAEEYLQKALTIRTEIGDKDGQATCYINLGNVFRETVSAGGGLYGYVPL